MRAATELNISTNCSSKQFHAELKKILMEAPPWRPISSRRLAALLGVSLQVLANWRVRGGGPQPLPPIKGKGNRTFYKPSEVVAWGSKFTSQPVEAWEVERDWLRAKELEVHGIPCREGTEWLISHVDGQLH